MKPVYTDIFTLDRVIYSASWRGEGLSYTRGKAVPVKPMLVAPGNRIASVVDTRRRRWVALKKPN